MWVINWNWVYLFLAVKKEPESPLKHLPATPKSENENNYDANSANMMTVDANYESEKASESDFEEPENKKFILQPTPAQLGQAPLQRRKNLGGGKSKITFFASDF